MANNMPMKMRAIAGALFLCCMSIISSTVTAANPPSDNELKAAYCLKITQRRLASSERLIGMGPEFKALHDKKVVDEKRLRGYLFPRLQVLDTDALLFAARRAEEDVESHKRIPICQQISSEPNKTLSQLTKQEIEAFEQCQEAIRNSAASKRISSCDDLTWLPF
jgi:hypothetical protein